MKKCPYCAEEIQDEAILCRYCGRDLQPPASTPPAQPAKAANYTIAVIISIIIVIVVLAFIGQSMNDNPPASKTQSIIYRVTGSAASADITYINRQGGTEQNIITIPWSKSLIVPSGSKAYISAQNNNKMGEITCIIELNGVEAKRSTSSGAYAIATCSGLVP